MRRHASYIVNPQSSVDADAIHELAQPAQAAPGYQATPQVPLKPAPEALPHPNAFHIAPAWVDSADRTRTWNLLDRHGCKMAEICTKRDASRLADILNRVRQSNRGR